MNSDILDLGCGNGNLAQELAQKGFKGEYLGLDSSEGLLVIARRNLSNYDNFRFVQCNLAEPGWDATVNDAASANMKQRQFDVALSFATLHHLPGQNLRIEIIKKIHNLINQSGWFILSNWQFMNSERLRKRIQEWEIVDLTTDDIDPGDYLLDWRQGGRGFRYAHHFSPEELGFLAEQTGFDVVESFLSDGENSNLGLYQVWQKL